MSLFQRRIRAAVFEDRVLRTLDEVKTAQARTLGHVEQTNGRVTKVERTLMYAKGFAGCIVLVGVPLLTGWVHLN